MPRITLVLTLFLLAAVPAGAFEVDVNDLTGEHWYGLYMNGQKVGYAVNRMTVENDGTVVFTQDASFKLNMVGMKQDMGIYNRRTYGPDGRLAHIESQVDDIAGTNVFRVTAEGDQLTVESHVGGHSKTATLPHSGETVEDVLQGAALVMDQPEVGKTLTFSLFEPMYQKSLNARSEIVGVEQRVLDGVAVDVYKIKTTIDLLGLDTISYVTEEGVSLEDQVGGMLTMRLEPEQVAKDVQYQNDVIVSNAARVDQPIDDPRTREELELTLCGPLTDAHLFTDGRQTIREDGDCFEFEGRRLDREAIVSLSLPIQDETVAEWQQPSMFVQSDHPKLVQKAKEIVGDETDALKAVDKLSRWVYENVQNTFSARLTNSLEVLNHMQGDCTEHSMLFIGLARAAGIPAREAAGLIYVDEPQPGFYFHQWATVWVGTWIDVDPTFDQTIADATHIKLAEGDLFKQVKLLPIIGQLSVSAD